MRGGRGGRGRGRFGRGGGGVAQDLIRDNLEDLGLEYNDVFKKNDGSVLDGNEAVSHNLFPVIDLVPPPNIHSLSEKQQYLIQCNSMLNSRCQVSSYFINSKAENSEIERYSDRKRRSVASVSLYDTVMKCFNDSQEEALKYIPSELLDSRALSGNLKLSQSRSKASRNTKGLDEAALQKLEQAEKNLDNGEVVATANKEEGEEDGEELAENEEVDDFELDDDYGVDHYASDNEVGDGGDFGDGGGEGDF